MRKGLVLMISVLFMACLASPAKTAELLVSYTIAQIIDEPEELKITISDNKIIVENAPVGSRIEIYSIVGLKVKEYEMRAPNGEYHTDIAKGYYIVRIADTVRKIVIR